MNYDYAAQHTLEAIPAPQVKVQHNAAAEAFNAEALREMTQPEVTRPEATPTPFDLVQRQPVVFDAPAPVQQTADGHDAAAEAFNTKALREMGQQSKATSVQHNVASEVFDAEAEAAQRAERARVERAKRDQALAEWNEAQDVFYVKQNNNQVGTITRLGLNRKDPAQQLAAEKEWLAQYYSTHPTAK